MNAHKYNKCFIIIDKEIIFCSYPCSSLGLVEKDQAFYYQSRSVDDQQRSKWTAPDRVVSSQ